MSDLTKSMCYLTNQQPHKLEPIFSIDKSHVRPNETRHIGVWMATFLADTHKLCLDAVRENLLCPFLQLRQVISLTHYLF